MHIILTPNCMLHSLQFPLGLLIQFIYIPFDGLQIYYQSLARWYPSQARPRVDFSTSIFTGPMEDVHVATQEAWPPVDDLAGDGGCRRPVSAPHFARLVSLTAPRLPSCPCMAITAIDSSSQQTTSLQYDRSTL